MPARRGHGFRTVASGKSEACLEADPRIQKGVEWRGFDTQCLYKPAYLLLLYGVVLQTGLFIISPSLSLSDKVLYWHEHCTNTSKEMKSSHLDPSATMPVSEIPPPLSPVLVALTAMCPLPLVQAHSSDNQHLTRWM